MIAVWVFLLVAHAQPQWARTEGKIPVRAQPDPASARIGWLDRDAVFAWTESAEGPGCESSHWAALLGGGFACLTDTQPSDEPPGALPHLVRFDPPAPEEWDSYLETGTWDRDPDTDEALMPYIYGKRWRRWKAPLYASLEAWNAGDEPIGRLSGGGSKAHFIEAVETERGTVLVRPDGAVAPLDETHIYPVDRFTGRDVVAQPLPDGWLPGWIVAYDGAELRDEPGGQTVGTLPYHAPVEVQPSDEGGWWAVRGDGGIAGYVDDKRSMRHWEPAPPPDEVGDGVWIDIVLDQQVLAVRRGEELEYVTLVSSGLTGRTPTGLTRIMDKTIHDDMRSREGASDPYFVEEVPWVIHFKPRYAIHGAYWHWGFGHKASHGCVNLSPGDARAVFDRVDPALPHGWHTVWSRDEDPGSWVRVR